MKYFRLHLQDSTLAAQRVWMIQEDAGKKRSSFHFNAVGLDCSTWTEDPEAEALFRQALNDLDILYEEGPEQQVIAKGFGIS